MTDLKKYINKILREESLKGNTDDLEEFIGNKSVFISNEGKDTSLQERLFSKIIRKKEYYDNLLNKLNKPDKLNTFGELIQLLIEKDNISHNIILKETHLEENELIKLLNNTIDITQISINKLVKLSKIFNLTLEIALQLLEKSIKLFQINPSVGNAMARYSYKDGLDNKHSSMKDGLNELLLKASQNKKLTHENIIPTNTPKNEFLDQFKKEFLKC